MTIVTRKHEISCGHVLTDHFGKCGQLHGHNYVFHLSFSGELDDHGMVVDFAGIKMATCQWLDDNWDHRFLVWEEDPRYEELRRIDRTVVGVPFNPTAENMANFVFNYAPTPVGIALHRVVVEETSKCSAQAG